MRNPRCQAYSVHEISKVPGLFCTWEIQGARLILYMRKEEWSSIFMQNLLSQPELLVLLLQTFYVNPCTVGCFSASIILDSFSLFGLSCISSGFLLRSVIGISIIGDIIHVCNVIWLLSTNRKRGKYVRPIKGQNCCHVSKHTCNNSSIMLIPFI